jgi:uncharacterized membrane protein
MIKMNLNIYIICVVVVALLAVPAMADNNTATIRGEVYRWDTFEPLENAVVEVNSTPFQSMVAKYGAYSFELEPGNYLITASYYQNGTLIYSAEESITVKGEGKYVLDLLLLPVYSQELMDNSSAGEVSENPEGQGNSSTVVQSVSNKSDSVNNPYIDNLNTSNVSVPETGETNGSTSPTRYYLLGVLMLSLLLAGGYKSKSHRDAEKNKRENDRPGKSQPETDKLQRTRLQEENTGHEKEKLSTSISMSEFSAKAPVLAKTPDEITGVEAEQRLPGELTETQFSEESEFKVREKEKQAENKEEQFPEIESTAFELETEENKEAFAEEKYPEEISLEKVSPEETVREPEPSKPPKSETLAIKKNLPLPADLQEIMDIIRGHGGRITQKDLRSKLKYSEGKVSLMLADLERRELIEKFKRGRGNIVILRDEER